MIALYSTDSYLGFTKLLLIAQLIEGNYVESKIY